MSISKEFVRLQELHENGTLTDAEFAEAKAKVLAGEPPATQRDIQRLQIQNEILRLDQDWQTERERYMMQGRSGPAYVPTIANSVGPALALGVTALFLIATAPSARQPNGMPIVGLILLVVGIVIGVSGVLKANAYDAAHENYQRQRRELTDQLEALR